MIRQIFLLLTTAALLAGCGAGDSGDEQRATLRIDAIGDIDAPDGAYALEGPRALISGSTQTGLVGFDAKGDIVPALATSWRVSRDGLSYIFRLRKAQWQDEREITAGDVVAVLRRVMAPGSRHPLKPYLGAIENAEAVARNRKPVRMLGVNDPRPDTVEIRLATPMPELLQLLAQPALSIQRKGDHPPAAGAFRLINARSNPITLLRNASYFDAGHVTLGRVEITPQQFAENAIARFERGETDIVTGASIDAIGLARTQRVGNALRLEPAWATYGYMARAIDGPLSDARVRRALSMAIDRGALVDRLFAIPAMQPLVGMLPSNVGDTRAAAPDWGEWTMEARRAEAARLLAEAGYGPDNVLEINVAIPAGRVHQDILAAASTDWAALGVVTRVRIRPPAQHARAAAHGDFDLALIERSAPAPLVSMFLSPLGCQKMPGGYCNPEADRLVTQAASAASIGEREQLMLRAARLYADDAPIVMLFMPIRWSLVHPRVEGWSANIAGAHPLSLLSISGKARRATAN